MNNRKLILVGGGGHCKSVIDVAESAGYSIIGILDKKECLGNKVLSYQVIGTDDDMYKYIDDALFLITVGQIKDVALRKQLYEKVKKVGGTFATVIASTAYVSKYAEIGEGTVVLHNAFINADARIGKECIINSFANIEHDVCIGDFCHISTGVMVNGNVKIGNDCFVGSQSVLINNISICSEVVIGSGYNVVNDIIKKGVYNFKKKSE